MLHLQLDNVDSCWRWLKVERQSGELGFVLVSQSFTVALEKASRKWEGTRAKKSQESQLRQALNTVFEVLGCIVTHSSFSSFNGVELEPEVITIPVVQECVERWRQEGKSPSTINSRLYTLGVLGIKTNGCWAKNKLPPKWWLRPEVQSQLITHLWADPPPFANAHLLGDYIEFVSHTGLRVEEALRLTWRDVTLRVIKVDGVLRSQSEMTPPGTKTRCSQASLPLGDLPALILLKRKKMAGDNPFVFPIKYDHLHEAWDKARGLLGELDNRMATLKALRRGAARHLTTNGMPTEMVRAYLRHSNIKTTMGYLHLVGGYNTNEMRKFLS